LEPKIRPSHQQRNYKPKERSEDENAGRIHQAVLLVILFEMTFRSMPNRHNQS
jgi:hypothetical protein